jgi:hypothetical protein
MRTPFVRPFFAKFFYALAVLGGGLATILLFAEFAGFYRVFGSKLASTLAVYGVLVTFYLWACALSLAAVGYVIELLAKIEWNTRPRTNEMGYAVEPAAGPSSSAGSPVNKQYYVSDKGRVTGPHNAAELLTLYRDGGISISAQVSVEENGQRRLLKNLSELGL